MLAALRQLEHSAIPSIVALQDASIMYFSCMHDFLANFYFAAGMV